MKMSSTAVAVLALAFAPSCLYADVTAPLAYRSPTPGDEAGPLGDEVTGEACSQILLGLVAWGDGGYGAAMADAANKSRSGELADVKVDRSLFNVVSLYQRICTRVRARIVP